MLALGLYLIRWSPLSQLTDRTALITTLTGLRESWWSSLAFLGLYTVLSPLGFPATPLILAGGVVYGVVAGTLLNAFGTFLGAAATYALGKVLGRDLVKRLAGERLRRVEELIAERSFWPLVGIRFIPIPFPLVNYSAALVGVPWSTFMVSSGLGLFPSMVLYTYFASVAYDAAARGDRSALLQMGIAFLLILTLGAAPQIWRWWRRFTRPPG